MLISNTVFGQNKGKFYATMQTRDAQGLKINHPDDIDIIYSLNEYSAVYLGPDAAEELHHKVLAHGPGFIYEPSKESAISTVNSSGPLSSKSLLNNSLISFAITQETLVNQSLNLVNNLNIADHITELENYGTRYHTTTSATQSVLDLKTKWEALAGNRADVSGIVDHTSTNMPSVIMTITGSENPDEFVIIGGHIDSTAFGNNNDAPRADNNASGTHQITYGTSHVITGVQIIIVGRNKVIM